MKFLIASLIFFVPEFVFAQSIVKNGGGLAEMEFIYYHQNLPAYIRPCLIRPTDCGLSEREVSIWRDLTERHDEEVQSVQIDFVHGDKADLPFVTSRRLGANVTVFTSALYQVNGEVRPPSEILAIVFAARLSHVDHTSDLQGLLAQARRWFKNLSVLKTSIQLYPANALYAVHHYVYEYQGSRLATMAVEDSSASKSLDELVTNALPCGTIVDWKFEGWKGNWIDESEISFQAEPSAACNTESRYLLFIHIKLDRQGSIDWSQIEVAFKPNF